MEINFKSLECTTKRCSACLFYKTLDEFYYDRTRKDSLRSQCKMCIKNYKPPKISCECGKEIFKNDIQKHITRPIHMKYLNFKIQYGFEESERALASDEQKQEFFCN
jgi:hypothetical protein